MAASPFLAPLRPPARGSLERIWRNPARPQDGSPVSSPDYWKWGVLPSLSLLYGEPQPVPPRVAANVAAAFLGMSLSADYIWRGFLGRRPPVPVPAPTHRAGGRCAGLPASRPLRAGPGRGGAAPPPGPPPPPQHGQPRLAQPPPRAGHRALGGGGGRGGVHGEGGRGRGAGAGARLCGGRGPRRPGAAPSAPRISYAPCPSLGSCLGRGGFFFFLEVPPPPPPRSSHREDSRLARIDAEAAGPVGRTPPRARTPAPALEGAAPGGPVRPGRRQRR